MKTSRVWPRQSPRSGGFTFIEMVIVVAIMGALALAIYPAINNTLRTRTFENVAKNILTTLQRAKLMAVRTKVSHRVRFYQTTGVWSYLIEEQTSPTTWVRVPGLFQKEIPSDFTTTVSLPTAGTLPGSVVTFSSLGYISDFTVNQNTVTMQSEKLKIGGQDDERVVSVYAGGSVLYAKDRSS